MCDIHVDRQVLYTDASWEVRTTSEGYEWIAAGLGAIFVDKGRQLHGLAGSVAPRLLPLLNPRKTQIVMAEALALYDT